MFLSFDHYEIRAQSFQVWDVVNECVKRFIYDWSCEHRK